jgi:hypothetical protein
MQHTRYAEITIWSAERAPAALRKAFHGLLSPNASIIKISSLAAQDAVVEAWVRSQSAMPVIARVQLHGGAVALLFAPSRLG